MTTIDLSFPITCNDPIPADHGYFLYGAISRLIPGIHKSNGIAVHPICGRQIGNRKLLLMPFSCLTVRTADAGIGELLTLAGKRILLGESSLRIGTPEVRTLQPAPALRSRLVTIKLKEVGDDPVGLSEDRFREAIRRQLDALGVSPEAIPTLVKRRTLRIKDKEVVGYEVILEGLTAEESLNIQEVGLGGRRHMGCGVFAPSGNPGGR